MHTVAYFGERYEKFHKVVGNIDVFNISTLSFDPVADVIIIDGTPKPSDTVAKGVIGVTLSDNREGLFCLMRSGVKTITCGDSIRDTISLSYILDTARVVLNKEISSVGGKLLSPTEYVVDGNNEKGIILLSAAARLLTGSIPI